MLRILLVEDDPHIADSIVRGLREEGSAVEHAADGVAGWEAMAAGQCDVVILDWWLPRRDGLSLLRQFRDAGHATPVLLLTARDAVSDRVAGLDAGADDYLCKPFAFAELVARVNALSRRVVPAATRLADQQVQLDLLRQAASRGGKPLDLTSKEQALLTMFVRHSGELLSRARIYRHIWGEEYDGLSNTLEVHVMELRRKLEAHGPRLIHTARGRGYWFGDGATTPREPLA